jgi:hypothetical protein
MKLLARKLGYSYGIGRVFIYLDYNGLSIWSSMCIWNPVKKKIR